MDQHKILMKIIHLIEHSFSKMCQYVTFSDDFSTSRRFEADVMFEIISNIDFELLLKTPKGQQTLGFFTFKESEGAELTLQTINKLMDTEVVKYFNEHLFVWKGKQITCEHKPSNPSGRITFYWQEFKQA